MIRETLDPDSAHAFMVVTPTQGVSFQRRPGTGAASTSDNSATGGSETAPYWVKIERFRQLYSVQFNERLGVDAAGHASEHPDGREYLHWLSADKP